MNNQIITNDMWPNNGRIMIEFSDYDLKFDQDIKTPNYRCIDSWIDIETIHEDDLEWEKDYVNGVLILCSEVFDYDAECVKYLESHILLGTEEVSIGLSNRIALSEAYDWVFTQDEGSFIEFSNEYKNLKFSIFSNDNKTEIIFLGLLIK